MPVSSASGSETRVPCWCRHYIQLIPTLTVNSVFHSFRVQLCAKMASSNLRFSSDWYAMFASRDMHSHSFQRVRKFSLPMWQDFPMKTNNPGPRNLTKAIHLHVSVSGHINAAADLVECTYRASPTVVEPQSLVQHLHIVHH